MSCQRCSLPECKISAVDLEGAAYDSHSALHQALVTRTVHLARTALISQIPDRLPVCYDASTHQLCHQDLEAFRGRALWQAKATFHDNAFCMIFLHSCHTSQRSYHCPFQSTWALHNCSSDIHISKGIFSRVISVHIIQSSSFASMSMSSI